MFERKLLLKGRSTALVDTTVRYGEDIKSNWLSLIKPGIDWRIVNIGIDRLSSYIVITTEKGEEFGFKLFSPEIIRSISKHIKQESVNVYIESNAQNRSKYHVIEWPTLGISVVSPSRVVNFYQTLKEANIYSSVSNMVNRTYAKKRVASGG